MQVFFSTTTTVIALYLMNLLLQSFPSHNLHTYNFFANYYIAGKFNEGKFGEFPIFKHLAKKFGELIYQPPKGY